MKKFIKILTSAFAMTSILSVATVTPIEVTRNNNINSNQIIKSNINNKQVVFQNTTNIDSILSKVPEAKVENMINDYYENNSLKNNAIFLQETSNYNKNQVIIQKMKQILNELYTHKISYKTLIQEVQNKYNNLTEKQKKFIKNKIQEAKNNRNINFQTSYFSYSVFTQTQNTQQIFDSVINNSQNVLNQLSKLKACAIAMAVATAAQWVAAAAEALIPFYGWVATGFTTAAAIADSAATAIAWTTYNQANNHLNKIIQKYLNKIRKQNWQQLKDDIKNLKSIFNGLKNNLGDLDISLGTAQGSNDADEWADPADVATDATISIVFTIIDSINLSISLTMSILFNLYTHWENQL